MSLRNMKKSVVAKPGIVTNASVLTVHVSKTKIGSIKQHAPTKKENTVSSTKHSPTKRGLYKCSVCEKSFRDIKTLADHKRVHTGEKRFRCYHCGLTFSLSTHLKSHDCLVFQCKDCKKVCLTEDALRSHQRQHAHQTCPHCCKFFQTTDLMLDHWKCNKCIKPTDNGSAGSGVDVVKDIKSFIEKAQLDRPKQSSTLVKVVMKMHAKKEKKEDKKVVLKYQCKLCEEKFMKHREYLIHKQQSHKKPKTNPCPHCKQAFLRPTSLSYHIKRVHTDPYTHVCAMCDAKFSNISELGSHIDLYHPELKVEERVDEEMSAAPTPKPAPAPTPEKLEENAEPQLTKKLKENKHQPRYSLRLRSQKKNPETSQLKRRRGIKEEPSSVKNKAKTRKLSGTKSPTKKQVGKKQPEKKQVGKKQPEKEQPEKKQVGKKQPEKKQPEKKQVGKKQPEKKQVGKKQVGKKQPEEKQEEKNQEDLKKGLRCTTCETYFQNSTLLAAHNCVRPSPVKQCFRCYSCGLQFIDSKLLADHTCVIPSSLSYKCSLCTETFTKYKYMKLHEGVHYISSTEKAYKCTACDMTYYSWSSLQKHAVVHKGLIFECPLCLKQFPTSGAQAQHDCGMKKKKKNSFV